MSVNAVLSLLFLLLVLAGVVFRVVYWPGLKRRRILARPFPEEWLAIVERRLPVYRYMPATLQAQLQDLIKVFLAEKNFVGCGGLRVTDEIRVTVAAQACLLLLGRETDCYSDLQSVLMYPSTFVATRDIQDELGLVSTDSAVLLGESWNQGKVILAWDSVEHGVRDPADGHNVVLHEFAHQLDHQSGSSNGAPLLLTTGAYRSWAHIFSREFEELQEDVRIGRESLLDHYGATNPAEFFAVATETFFERPEQLKHSHRELYDELLNFYQVNPLDWSPG